VSLSIKQKFELFNYARSNPHLKQTDLVDWINKEFKLKVDRSTVSKIINNPAFEKKNKESEENIDGIRSKPVRFPELESLLKEWFLRYENVTTITDGMLIEKGKQFAKQLNITEDQLCFSNGWIRSFKARNNIKSYHRFGESGSVNTDVVEKAIPDLISELEKYDANDIFNFDETALFYRMEPDRTLATKRIEGRKKDKERITIGLCTNATGKEKMAPLVIGKYKNPRCFKNVNLGNIGISYKNNNKAWMTAQTFQEWLQTFDKIIRLSSPERRVLLLLDNAGSHSLHGIELKNVEIKFLPPNTTSKLQPLDAGIIACFKRKYRRHFQRFLIEELEKNLICPSKLDLLNAIRFVVEAWNGVSIDTIINCWNHTGIIKRSLPVSECINDEENNDITCISNDITKLNLSQPMSINEYINFHEERIIEDIIDCDPMKELEEDADEDIEELDDTYTEEIKISNTEALDMCKNLIKYLEHNNEDLSSHVSNLRNLKFEIERKQANSLKQTSLFDYFKSV
jgi:hypothetical protein